MNNIYLFSDASCNPLKNKSIGCYTLVSNLDNLDIFDTNILNIQKHEMDFSSSTLAELHTIKEALKYAHSNIKYNNNDNTTITLYVDCKNFVDLIKKRKDKENLKDHRNYELYCELINLVSLYNTNIIWTKGHDKKGNKNEVYQKIFSKVDKTARELSRSSQK